MKSCLVILFALLSCVSGSAADGRWINLFDGESLKGWEGNLDAFRIEDHAIVGGTLAQRIPHNEFLCSKKNYRDFELRLEFRLVGEEVNGGIQFRSRRIAHHYEVSGYQADLGQVFWGSLYDESRRRRILAQADMAELGRVLDTRGWNRYVIRCEGRRIRLWINDYKTVDYREPDPEIPQEGLICLQIHAGQPGEAWYRNLQLKELTPPETPPLAPGVRGVATRAPAGMVIDGDLSEFKDAFATPIGYFHSRLRDRAAQFFYMWDDEAFYSGLRTLDTRAVNQAPDNRLWEGDGVEWYFDTRRGPDFRNRKWGKGSVHCYWAGLKGDKVEPRFCLRPGYLDAIEKKGVEVAARKTKVGMDVEFKLPWANFPNFKPTSGEVIGVDSELCYSDGGPRVDRAFIYGGPLSVQQPANLARIQLVQSFKRGYWRACGAVLAPVRCDVPWSQPAFPKVTAYMALPPNRSADIGKVVFRVQDLNDSILGEYPGEIETFEEAGLFRRAVAHWPSRFSPPGTFQLMGILYDKQGAELTRVAPRMVSVGMHQGF